MQRKNINETSDLPRPFLKDYLPFLMVRAHALMTARLNEEIQQQGFTTAEWRILATIHDCGVAGGLTINRLSEITNLTQPTVSRWVSRLQKKNLILRRESRDDLRHSMIDLSSAGKRAASELVLIASAHQKEAFSIFSRSDVSKLTKMLQELVIGLEEESDRQDRLGRRRLL